MSELLTPKRPNTDLFQIPEGEGAYSPNLGLYYPDREDFVRVNDLNYNFQIIDENLGGGESLWRHEIAEWEALKQYNVAAGSDITVRVGSDYYQIINKSNPLYRFNVSDNNPNMRQTLSPTAEAEGEYDWVMESDTSPEGIRNYDQITEYNIGEKVIHAFGNTQKIWRCDPSPERQNHPSFTFPRRTLTPGTCAKDWMPVYQVIHNILPKMHCRLKIPSHGQQFYHSISTNRNHWESNWTHPNTKNMLFFSSTKTFGVVNENSLHANMTIYTCSTTSCAMRIFDPTGDQYSQNGHSISTCGELVFHNKEGFRISHRSLGSGTEPEKLMEMILHPEYMGFRTSHQPLYFRAGSTDTTFPSLFNFRNTKSIIFDLTPNEKPNSWGILGVTNEDHYLSLAVDEEWDANNNFSSPKTAWWYYGFRTTDSNKSLGFLQGAIALPNHNTTYNEHPIGSIFMRASSSLRSQLRDQPQGVYVKNNNSGDQSWQRLTTVQDVVKIIEHLVNVSAINSSTLTLVKGELGMN